MSNYYTYEHTRRARISIEGLHHYIRRKVAELEGIDERYCQIVDTHYFRGRLSAADAQERDVLFNERAFDDVLIREGVTTHYLPLASSGEKGIDVWFSLEAFELAMYKRFTVSVLITGDSDYIPLVRKLNTLGTRVMLLGWDFEYTDRNGETRTTRTSQGLLEEVTYPVLMSDVIEDRSMRNNPVVNNLFMSRTLRADRRLVPEVGTNEGGEFGAIATLRAGYGWIKPEAGGNDLYFYHQDVQNADFNVLQEHDRVRFERSTNDRGPCAVSIYVTESA